MVTVQISFEHLLETIDHLPEDQKKIVLERIRTGINQEVKSNMPQKRIAGLGEGTIWMSDDFTEPLPDNFWFGEGE